MVTVPAVRLAVGYAAVAATVAYMTLEGVGLFGGTVGMADTGCFGSLSTAGMDAVAILIAISFTHAWGLRRLL